MTTAYLDSSALVKLIVAEEESTALLRHVSGVSRPVTSALARTEVTRAVTRLGAGPVPEGFFARLNQLRVDDEVLDRASRIAPASVRSLDAIHLASATMLGTELDEVITYDSRMAAAAEGLGLRVVTPR